MSEKAQEMSGLLRVLLVGDSQCDADLIAEPLPGNGSPQFELAG